MNRLLVVRLGSLGDLVHTLPAVSAIRRTFPNVEIDWLVDAVHAEFLALVPILTTIVPLHGRNAAAWLRARRDLKRRRYDVALDFQGLLKSAALARLSGARRVLGFDRGSLREGTAAPFYTEQAQVGEGRHVIEKNLRLAAAIGAHAAGLEFPIAPVKSDVVSAFVARRPGPFALVNPCAAWPNKQWPPERLGHIAAAIRERHGLGSVVLWGPDEEALADSVVKASRGAAVAAPNTTLTDLVALARHARLMISGDTGPLHIAAALGVRVVALFGPTDPARNGPWDRADCSLSRYEQCACHYERRCRYPPKDWCLGSIEEDEVLEAIERRLRPPAEPAGARPPAPASLLPRAPRPTPSANKP
jgi:lipopolysaccharide heptosyltransferase I